MRPRRLLVTLVVGLVGAVAVAAFIGAMLMVVYPGAFRWTAPMLCPDRLPDPVVVRYDVQTSDGQATNFTLFCLGERGEFTEVGTWQPFVLLTAYTAGAILALTIPWVVIRTVKGLAGRRPRTRPVPGAIPEQAGLPSQPSPEKSDSPLIS